MNRRMITWQLFASYIVIMLLVCLMTAGAFYRYNIYTTQRAGEANLAAACNIAVEKIDQLLQSADQLSIAVTADMDFVTTMQKLSGPQKNAMRSQLQNILFRAFEEHSAVYRISVFDNQGTAVSFGPNQLDSDEIKGLLTQQQWLACRSLGGNAKFITGPHADHWVKQNPRQVISLLRTVYVDGQPVGYIEVQLLERDIVQRLTAYWNGEPLFFAITRGNQEIVFSNLSPTTASQLGDSLRAYPASYPVNPVNIAGSLIAVGSSNIVDWDVVLLMPKELLFENAVWMRRAILVSVTLIIAVMTLFYIAILERVTKPIYQLMEQVKGMSLSNLDGSFAPVKGSYEVEVLSNAFVLMKDRIADAIAKEKLAERMRIQALFQSLQSRMGPHFIYNTLGSIANMCERGETTQAAEACYSLSDTLRYSSRYTDVMVTVQEEFDNLQNYLVLMKGRYRQRLAFTVDLQADASPLLIPKLTVQPLVENAIRHTLAEQEQVNIAVTAIYQHNVFTLSVTDNGVGFSSQTMLRIQKAVADFYAAPAQFAPEQHLRSGGIGLIGTLLRLCLQYGERFDYDINALQPRGSAICLRIESDDTLSCRP